MGSEMIRLHGNATYAPSFMRVDVVAASFKPSSVNAANRSQLICRQVAREESGGDWRGGGCVPDLLGANLQQGNNGSGAAGSGLIVVASVRTGRQLSQLGA